jgi:alkaline phosphatase isozyme conversion protein
VTALRTRGAWLAIAVGAVLVVAVGVAAAGAFGGCDETATKAGRPSAAVTATAFGSVGYVTAKTFAQTVPRRVADTWGEIHAREFVFDSFQRYGYFPRLQEFIARGKDGRVHSGNIIAVKEGDSAKQLIVGAHYDSAAVGQGYADNATGIGLLLETAARLKRQPTPYTIVFVAFGAEEQGDVGSRYYVSRLGAVERKATLGMVNLDAPAGGPTISVTSAPGGPTWLRDDVLAAAQAQGLEVASGPAGDGLPAGVARTPGDDDPFAALGIATATFTSGAWDGSGAGVAAHDTVPYIDGRFPGRVKQQLRQLSRLLETLLTSKLETHR